MAVSTRRVWRAAPLTLNLVWLFDLLEVHDRPPEDARTRLRIRRARPDETWLLTKMERATGEAHLGHVFDPERHGYPTVLNLAEVPEHGRRGFGATLPAYATEETFDRGLVSIRLWGLTDNAAPRSLYGGLGWRESGACRQREFPSHPEEFELAQVNRAPRRAVQQWV